MTGSVKTKKQKLATMSTAARVEVILQLMDMRIGRKKVLTKKMAIKLLNEMGLTRPIKENK